MRSYRAALAAFAKAAEYLPHPVERVEIASPDGILPGYLIPARAQGPAPVVIFYSGLDVTKEILYGIIRNELADRGIACLVVDTPGVGEPLRLRGVPSRPDYLYDAAGSADKTLRIFTVAEGGAEHVNADDPDPARQLIADWFADRLGTIPART